MNIPKKMINKWLSEDHSPEGIAQRAVEWERERLELSDFAVMAINRERDRLSKIAGEPVAVLDSCQVDHSKQCCRALQCTRKMAVYTQDQLLGAIVRAEDAALSRYSVDFSQLKNQETREAIARWLADGTLLDRLIGVTKEQEKRITELESQLAQCKEDAERLREGQV